MAFSSTATTIASSDMASSVSCTWTETDVVSLCEMITEERAARKELEDENKIMTSAVLSLSSDFDDGQNQISSLRKQLAKEKALNKKYIKTCISYEEELVQNYQKIKEQNDQIQALQRQLAAEQTECKDLREQLIESLYGKDDASSCSVLDSSRHSEASSSPTKLHASQLSISSISSVKDDDMDKNQEGASKPVDIELDVPKEIFEEENDVSSDEEDLYVLGDGSIKSVFCNDGKVMTGAPRLSRFSDGRNRNSTGTIPFLLGQGTCTKTNGTSSRTSKGHRSSLPSELTDTSTVKKPKDVKNRKAPSAIHLSKKDGQKLHQVIIRAVAA